MEREKISWGFNCDPTNRAISDSPGRRGETKGPLNAQQTSVQSFRTAVNPSPKVSITAETVKFRASILLFLRRFLFCSLLSGAQT
jgi:hypothetical protein